MTPRCPPLKTRPINLRDANTFIKQKHRHHPQARGCKFVLSVVDQEGTLHGVAITSRPVARLLNHTEIAEVIRLCTDGTKNACSMLYSACARIAKEMGYLRIITYILASESGASLRAAGWIETGRVRGYSWNRRSRQREDVSPIVDKIRYERILSNSGRVA